MIIAYTRVNAPQSQPLFQKENIEDLLTERRLVADRWVNEVVAAGVPWQQRELGKLIGELMPWDYLVIDTFDRLARDEQTLGQILTAIRDRRAKVYIAAWWSEVNLAPWWCLAECPADLRPLIETVVVQRTP
jgi:DNA invertase Pin-like site-specific DNA recombinase